MTWVKLDDGFPDHEKVDRAGDLAAWMFVCSLCHAAKALTDGFIATSRVRKLTNLSRPDRLAAKLVEVGLWEPVEDGYRIHDYHQYNPAASVVKERREKDRQRKESGRNPGGQGKESDTNPAPPAGTRAGPRAGAGAGLGIGELSKKNVEALLDAEVAADGSIKQPAKWRDWRRPFLVAELEEAERKRLDKARREGVRLAKLYPDEPDDSLIADLRKTFLADDARAAAVQEFRATRATGGAA